MNFIDKIKNKLRVYLNILLVLFIISLILSIFRNLSKINKAKGKVAKVEQNIEKLIRENKELEERLKEVQSTQFVEKEIRDKLGLAKEGEIVVVLPDEEILRKLAPKIEEEETELPDPNWKKWIKLFYRE